MPRIARNRVLNQSMYTKGNLKTKSEPLSNKGDMKYKKKKNAQVHLEEREYIEYLRNTEKRSIGKIARILKRSKSTISTELRRTRGAYSAEKAEAHRDRKQYHKHHDWMKIVSCKVLQDYVTEKLKTDWSPEEIAGRIKYIDTTLPAISAPSIYKFIYSVHGRNLEHYLRYGKQKRTTSVRDYEKIAERTFIDKRPKKVATRRFFGDWEADFICSGKYGTGYLLVFVERKTRFVVIKRILTKDIATVHTLFENILGVRFIVNTLTIDNDIVFRRHVELSALIGAPVFFTHPYHSWEKGTVENMNKWIRQYVPKRSDISLFSDAYIQIVEDKLNDRPRACLGFQTPRETLSKEKSLRKEVGVIQSKQMVVV